MIIIYCLLLYCITIVSNTTIKLKENVLQSGGNSFNVIKTIEKNTRTETSGLLISTSGRKLYESTYINGQAYLIKLNFSSGEVIQSLPLSNSLQGRGIGQCHYHLFQFTNSRSVLEYKYPNDVTLIQSLAMPNEMINGYGLTKFDHKTLVASDGTNRIFFLDCYRPLNVNKILNVFSGENKLRDINALAVANNYIYATVYKKNMIYKIDPSTGLVVQKYNFDSLAENDYHQRSSYTNSNSDNFSNSNYDKWENWLPWDTTYDYNRYDGSYLNGIAYDPSSKNFIVTGKNWRYFYIISLN